MASFLQEVKRRVAYQDASPPPLWLWTRKHLTTIAFVAGFIIDNLTLTRVDVLLNDVYLVSLFAITGTGIVYTQSIDSGKNPFPFLQKYRAWLPIIVQFSFGSLFSAFLIFYTRGASLLSSWPFLLILAILFYGSEFMKSHFERLLFQINVFFFALFSYMTFLLPVLFRRIGDLMFLASGIVSLVLTLIFLHILARVVPYIFEGHRRSLFASIGGIYIVFTLFYFLNLIPPLPLSLTTIGLYHSVTKSPQGGYITTYEQSPWYMFWRDTAGTFHISGNATEALYCFGAVFAPARLTTTIVHDWDYFDAEKNRWVKKSSVSYTIQGGRDGGYRGYSIRKNPDPGVWRCTVKNENGQILGTIQASVESNTKTSEPKLLERLQ